MLDTNRAPLELDLIMTEQVHPVSGNTAPIGSKPEDVRDARDIRVSSGRYVINAQTERCVGSDCFHEIQNSTTDWR